jgi:hypothetical protein
LPPLDPGKPPIGGLQAIGKLISSDTPNQGMQKKVQLGGSLNDIYKEANDIIEEFKREEETANQGAQQKYLVKRNSHSAALNTINIGIPVALGNLNNNRATKHNNFNL